MKLPATIPPTRAGSTGIRPGGTNPVLRPSPQDMSSLTPWLPTASDAPTWFRVRVSSTACTVHRDGEAFQEFDIKAWFDAGG